MDWTVKLSILPCVHSASRLCRCRMKMKMVRLWIWSGLFTNKAQEVCLRMRYFKVQIWHPCQQLLSCIVPSHQGYHICHSGADWPNGTNVGLFKISFSTFWLGEQSDPILVPNLPSLYLFPWITKLPSPSKVYLLVQYPILCLWHIYIIIRRTARMVS